MVIKGLLIKITKKIEAMYHKGYSIDYICNATKESPITVICIMQRIFAMDHM